MFLLRYLNFDGVFPGSLQGSRVGSRAGQTRGGYYSVGRDRDFYPSLATFYRTASELQGQVRRFEVLDQPIPLTESVGAGFAMLKKFDAAAHSWLQNFVAAHAK